MNYLKEKDIQALIGLGVNKIIIRQEDYDKLSNETKNLMKLNDANLKILGSENNGKENKNKINKSNINFKNYYKTTITYDDIVKTFEIIEIGGKKQWMIK